jgi:hypothetical protein
VTQKLILTDDIDGSHATETITFQLGTTIYEIDLSPDHADTLRTRLAPYINAGRRIPTTPSPRAASTGRSRAIRRWALARDKPITDPDAIPDTIINAYFDAHTPGA